MCYCSSEYAESHPILPPCAEVTVSFTQSEYMVYENETEFVGCLQLLDVLAPTQREVSVSILPTEDSALGIISQCIRTIMITQMSEGSQQFLSVALEAGVEKAEEPLYSHIASWHCPHINYILLVILCTLTQQYATCLPNYTAVENLSSCR